LIQITRDKRIDIGEVNTNTTTIGIKLSSNEKLKNMVAITNVIIEIPTVRL